MGIPYVLSMLVYPSIVGDWNHVHSVWYTWQSLNTGVLAFVASILALNAVRYSEEKGGNVVLLHQKHFFLKHYLNCIHIAMHVRHS